MGLQFPNKLFFIYAVEKIIFGNVNLENLLHILLLFYFYF